MTNSLTSDLEIISLQLGRDARGVIKVCYRTQDDQPAVIMTNPVLPDGTPFPTLYYLTEPRLTSLASSLESVGFMNVLTELLDDPIIAGQYLVSHQNYLKTRNQLHDLGTEFSGGGMPDRVKCLHVLMGYSLAEGPTVNPIGDIAVKSAIMIANPNQRLALPKDVFDKIEIPQKVKDFLVTKFEVKKV